VAIIFTFHWQTKKKIVTLQLIVVMDNILTEFEQTELRTKEASNLRIGAFIIDFILQVIIAFVYIRLQEKKFLQTIGR
jgi:hypothetical protein